MSVANESKDGSFLGETLFHFLGHGDDERLLDVFDSIVRRGLLLTVGNKEGKLDKLPVEMVGEDPEILDVMQHARVCFTDIPESLLSAHCQEYGTFGIGFSRKTILEWGGNPVVYVPNHPAPETLETSMAGMLYCMHRASPLMNRLKECLAEINASRPIGQRDMDGENGAVFINYIDQFEKSVQRMLSFVKVMSSQNSNDYQYLYEREWRIVDGVMKREVDPTRELSDDECREFAAKCQRWTKPLEMSEPLSQKHPHKSMLQFFRIFDGLPGKTISQAIDVVLVPSDAVKGRVAAYITDRPNKFRPGGPAIRVFGESASSRCARA